MEIVERIFARPNLVALQELTLNAHFFVLGTENVLEFYFLSVT